MEEEHRWPRDLLRDLDRLSVSTDRDQMSIPRYSDAPPIATKAFRPQLKVVVPGTAAPATVSSSPRKALILCFDGTGNKFQGTSADSNIVKIFSLLDRQDENQYHYYQPGIGTYVETNSLSRKSRAGRLKSWYIKAKDQAVGTSFAEHVMAGYKFLMRYYSPGSEVYFFGFSRGAYTARFLAQMLDYIGLLSTGNEEMLRFAWKTFARWQARTESTLEEKDEKHKTFHFMKRFRETFSRPIDRIRFIGLFDCVNSVPQFEAAWMSRSKFPYTAKTSAEIIRHAVSIDERRAKFRQDLVSEQHTVFNEHWHRRYLTWRHKDDSEASNLGKPSGRPSVHRHASSKQARFRPPQQRPRTNVQFSTATSQISVDSTARVRERQAEPRRGDESPDGDDGDDDEQDILEVWFAGQHGDIGGGWPGEDRPASDVPLMWMLREAQKAGMPFDEAKLEAAHLVFNHWQTPDVPVLEIDGRPLGEPPEAVDQIKYLQTETRLHDSLAFGGGLSRGSVLAWQFMEHLPFRRMDLQPDGSWKPISWPLPRGETRDMPADAVVHSSVIRRMEAKEDYRPGNLIVGGGGRGVRRAPMSAGIGQWHVVRDEGDLIGEAVVRLSSSKQHV